MSGKGSAPRPFSVDAVTFNNNWELIFGKKQQQETATAVENSSAEIDDPSKFESDHTPGL